MAKEFWVEMVGKVANLFGEDFRKRTEELMALIPYVTPTDRSIQDTLEFTTITTPASRQEEGIHDKLTSSSEEEEEETPLGFSLQNRSQMPLLQD